MHRADRDTERSGSGEQQRTKKEGEKHEPSARVSEERTRNMYLAKTYCLFKAPTMNECEEARGLRSFAFQKDSNYSKNLLERSV